MPENANVAVLMCVYGRDSAEHFSAALASVCAQTIAPRLKIYVGVDGPISVELECVLSDYGNAIHRLVRSEENVGLARMLNRLIDSLGDEQFVARMDADDVCLPIRMETQVRYLERNPDVDILGSAIEEFYGDHGRAMGVRAYPRAAQVRRYLRLASPLAHPAVCFRRSALFVLRGYPIEMGNEDIAMWFAAVSAGLKIDNLPQVLVRYRVNPAFYGRRSVMKAWGEARVYVRGIYRLEGVSPWLVVPLVRFCFRLMPVCVVRVVYHAVPIRAILLNRRPREKS